MTASVRLGAEHVFKRFEDSHRASLAEARAIAAEAAGVATPGATLSRSGRLLRFPRIIGSTGLEALRKSGASILPELLEPVARLHAMSPCEGLHAHDPLQKILSRMDGSVDEPVLPFLERALNDLALRPGRACVVHGDLHARQLLIDGAGQAWLLDLDDMALGDPAADLGNFAAHLATSEPSSPRSPRTTMQRWLRETMAAYRELGGEVDEALADAHGRVALVRRALKLREKGDDRLARWLDR